MGSDDGNLKEIEAYECRYDQIGWVCAQEIVLEVLYEAVEVV
jgi:hypothetical protein